MSCLGCGCVEYGVERTCHFLLCTCCYDPNAKMTFQYFSFQNEKASYIYNKPIMIFLGQSYVFVLHNIMFACSIVCVFSVSIVHCTVVASDISYLKCLHHLCSISLSLTFLADWVLSCLLSITTKFLHGRPRHYQSHLIWHCQGSVSCILFDMAVASIINCFCARFVMIDCRFTF